MSLDDFLSDFFGLKEGRIQKLEERADSARSRFKGGPLGDDEEGAKRYALMQGFYARLKEHSRGDDKKRFQLASQWYDYASTLSRRLDRTFVNLESTPGDTEKFTEYQQEVWNDDERCEEIENIFAKALGAKAEEDLKHLRKELSKK